MKIVLAYSGPRLSPKRRRKKSPVSSNPHSLQRKCHYRCDRYISSRIFHNFFLGTLFHTGPTANVGHQHRGFFPSIFLLLLGTPKHLCQNEDTHQMAFYARTPPASVGSICEVRVGGGWRDLRCNDPWQPSSAVCECFVRFLSPSSTPTTTANRLLSLFI